MSTATIYELIGYAGSALIVISLAMSSIIKLRVINLLGALTFGLYGLLIGSMPVLITNVIIAGLNTWYLRKELSTREEIKVISVEIDDPVVAEFLRYYESDIEKYRPGFSAPSEPDVALLMLRDVNPAGLFIGTPLGTDVLNIDLDYVAPPYRDLRSGVSLYGDDGIRFTDLGWTSLNISNVNDRQRDYFESMGFTDADAGSMTRVFLKS